MSDRSATNIKIVSTSSTHKGETIKITQANLPLYCPPASAPTWSLHPRVFLDFDSKEAKCPYCGAQYELNL